MDVRVATVRVVIVSSAFLAVGCRTASLHSLVAADVQPCTVPKSSSTSTEGVRHDVHRTTFVLAQRVLWKQRLVSVAVCAPMSAHTHLRPTLGAR